jgi:type IV secretion system protein VirB10
VIIVAAFLLLAAGVSVYYIPSIIRSMSSGDEKPASNAVSTGSVKRRQVSAMMLTHSTPGQNRLRRKSGRKAATKRKCQRKKYSRTSVVRLMWPMEEAALLPQVPWEFFIGQQYKERGERQ